MKNLNFSRISLKFPGGRAQYYFRRYYVIRVSPTASQNIFTHTPYTLADVCGVVLELVIDSIQRN